METISQNLDALKTEYSQEFNNLSTKTAEELSKELSQ